MDGERGAVVEETAETKQKKPRGTCTGCEFSYQLGTARTGEHKGKQVIRKHSSRTGPGLCSGAQQPPEGAEETVTHVDISLDYPKTAAGHCVQGRCEGCCGCSSMCTTDPCGQPGGHPDAYPGDVVGVAPGGTPVVADPFTAPTTIAEGDVSDETTRGPWVRAGFDGECNGTCGGSLHEGDEIRADGEGGWLCQDCGADEPLRVETRTAPLPHDQWTPTGTVLDRMTPEQRAETLSASNTVVGIHRDVMPPVSITEVHAENPPRVVQSGPYAGAVVTVTAPDVFTAPAPASDIPESTTTVSGQPEPDRDRWGRYLIFGKPHTRATTFAKLGANTKAIEAWNERNVIRGLTLRPDLLMLADGLEVKRDRNDLNSIAAQAKDAAGSKVAANIGTAYHAFTERIDAHLMTLPEVPQQYQGRVFQYIDAIARAGLTTRPEWIERTTAVRADQIGAPLPVAGTLDRIFQLPDGSLVIGDLKTGFDLSYGEMEIEVQLAVYAHGVNTHGLFDWNTKTWHPVEASLSPDYAPVKVRTDIAIVVHLPADGDGCTLYVADIERGWRDAQRLGPLQASLKEKKRFRTLTAADLAPSATPSIRTDHVYDDGHGGVWAHPGYYEECTTPECEVRRGGPYTPATPVTEPHDSQWEKAKALFSSAASQEQVAQLYQYAMDSGKFHADQLAVLVGLGKDRLNALAQR